MTKYFIHAAITGLASEIPQPDNPTGGVSDVATTMYIESDTGAIKLSTGQAWQTIGQLPVGTSYPGVTSNGAGGITAGGDQNFGNPSATQVPSFLNLYGCIVVFDTDGNQDDGDPVFNIVQFRNLKGNNKAYEAFGIKREGQLEGFDYAEAMFYVRDDTDSAQPLQRFIKGGVDQVVVDGDGLRVHGKFKTGQSATHSLGSYSGNAVPIYDESGTLLGYMPLYN